MQIKLFTVPIGDSGGALDEMNRFLKSNKILEVQNQLISNENGAYWCFCVRYIEKNINSISYNKTKVDYKHILDDATFKKFSKLREIRKGCKRICRDCCSKYYRVMSKLEITGTSLFTTRKNE